MMGPSASLRFRRYGGAEGALQATLGHARAGCGAWALGREAPGLLVRVGPSQNGAMVFRPGRVSEPFVSRESPEAIVSRELTSK